HHMVPIPAIGPWHIPIITDALYLYCCPPPFPPPPPLPAPPWRAESVAMKSSSIRFGDTRVVPYTRGMTPPCWEVWNCSAPTAFCCLAFDPPVRIPPMIDCQKP